MFRAASTLPAPRPYGIPQRQRARKEWLTENPNSATAVVRTLTAVIFPVPKRVFRRSLFKLDTIVPAAIIIEMMPAEETEVPSSGYMTGHAEPSRESGSPRLMNAR